MKNLTWCGVLTIFGVIALVSGTPIYRPRGHPRIAPIHRRQFRGHFPAFKTSKNPRLRDAPQPLLRRFRGPPRFQGFFSKLRRGFRNHRFIPTRDFRAPLNNSIRKPIFETKRRFHEPAVAQEKIVPNFFYKKAEDISGYSKFTLADVVHSEAKRRSDENEGNLIFVNSK